VRRSVGRPPALGLLLAGRDPGSEVYVRNKVRQSGGLGIRTALERLPESAAFAEALAVVEAVKRMDKAAGRGVRHKNTAARRKSKLARLLNEG